MNMKRYREQNWQNRMLEGMARYNSLLEFPDNDLICKLMQDEIILMPPKYNVISAMYMGDYNKCMKMRRPSNYYSQAEFDEAKKNPTIIHYTTCFAFVGRPWLKGCTHPEKARFDECYKLTPWSDDEYRQPKSHSRDFIRSVYLRMPEGMGNMFIWFLHSWLKPNIQFFTKKRYKRIFRSIDI